MHTACPHSPQLILIVGPLLRRHEIHLPAGETSEEECLSATTLVAQKGHSCIANRPIPVGLALLKTSVKGSPVASAFTRNRESCMASTGGSVTCSWDNVSCVSGERANPQVACPHSL